jgi:hypothetical protein
VLSFLSFLPFLSFFLLIFAESLQGPNLIVITRIELLGTLNAAPVYQIREVEVVPLEESQLDANVRPSFLLVCSCAEGLEIQEQAKNQRYIQLIERLLGSSNQGKGIIPFYFSEKDITQNYQQLSKDPKGTAHALHTLHSTVANAAERADERFCWNSTHIKTMLQLFGGSTSDQAKRSIMSDLRVAKIIQGSVHSRVDFQNSQTVTLDSAHFSSVATPWKSLSLDVAINQDQVYTPMRSRADRDSRTALHATRRRRARRRREFLRNRTSLIHS